MSASFSELMEVKNSLRQQHIAVPDEWVEACIAFVKQKQGQNLALPNLKKSVYQQWLLADLEEIACSALPPQLPTLEKITLKNNFALQVQGIRDVSKPAYSQLKQLEGSINSNAEFTSAPKAAIPEWEAKPTRMLMLNLTDGCINVQGMEYRTINCLSPNLHPGIKVLIKAPVQCRFGVLLLQQENVRILGGEVESKITQYSRENMLKMQLQLPLNEDNQEISEENANLNSSQDANVTSTSLERPIQINSVSSSSIQHNQTQVQSNTQWTTSNNSVSRNLLNIQNSHQSVIIEEGIPDLVDSFGSDDDFEEIIDYDKIDEIENTQRQVEEKNTSTNIPNDRDIWEEDEDVVRDLMEFQDTNPDFEMPFEMDFEPSSTNQPFEDSQEKPIFTYLSTVCNDPSSDCVITIKGFIVTVSSKLEISLHENVYHLLVTINDGTASIVVNMDNKVLETFMGLPARDMKEKQNLAAKDPAIKKEVNQAISNIKMALLNLNCLMDVKFVPGEKPCVIKCSDISHLQLQQMLQKTRKNV